MRSDQNHGVRRIARPRRRSDEQGIAMIVAVGVAAIGLVLATTVLSVGVHLQQATGRDRSWNDALQVAEGGVEHAVTQLTTNLNYTGSVGTVTVPGGQFETTVTTPAVGYRVVTATGYVPAKGAANAVSRKVQATYGPASSFRYALFSDNGLTVDNGDTVTGDIYANGFLGLAQTTTVSGNVISAQSGVSLANNVTIKADPSGYGGNIYTGGSVTGPPAYAVQINNQALVTGSVWAQAQACPATLPDPNRNILNNGTIQGQAVAAGTISGTAQGGVLPVHCENIPQISIRHLPVFHWDPSIYGTTPTEMDARAFQTYLNTRPPSLTGVYHVLLSAGDTAAGVDSIDLTGTTITGNFTLVTDARITYLNNTTHRPFFSGDGSNAVINIITLNTNTTTGAIDIENQLQTTTTTTPPAILFYSPGLISVKNNGQTDGSVFAGIVQLKNGSNVAYDPRVERTLGFGENRFERVSWVELTGR